MPSYMILSDLDQAFHTSKIMPFVINDVVIESEEDRAAIDQKLTTTFDEGNMISVMPSCSCRKTTGTGLLGQICPDCGTPVRSVTSDDYVSVFWMRAPDDLMFVNPEFMIMLRDRFKRSGYCIISWICDTRYDPGVKKPSVIDKIQALGIKNLGYKYFIDNIDFILTTLFNMREFKVKKQKFDYLYGLYKMSRKSVLCKYIPIPNKAVLIVEKTSVGIYIEESLDSIRDAINMMLGIDTIQRQCSPIKKERLTFKTILALSDFYKKYCKKTEGSKPGIIRKHLFAWRSYFTFRQVMTSITEPHHYDEIVIPWGVMVTSFRPMLMNKLINVHNFTRNQAIKLLTESYYHYNDFLYTIFMSLIDETPIDEDFMVKLGYPPKKGIPCLMARNPALHSGSMQYVKVVDVEKNPLIRSVRSSILIVVPFNLDFDGDECNFSIAIDQWMANKWKPLAPHNNVLTLSSPWEVSNNLSIPAPVVTNIDRMVFFHDYNNVNPTVIERMKTITKGYK